MKFASVAIVAAVAVSVSATPVVKTTNPHEITCAQKFSLETTRATADKVCCDYSHNCGELRKCTPSFCEVAPVPKPECMMYCKHGFVTDKKGNEICKCAEKPECMMYCKHGFVTDKHGDEICNCAKKPRNEYEITCAEKRERNPKALNGRINKNKPCCQWSGRCGNLKKCTQSYCQKDAKPSRVYGDRYDFQF